MHHLEDAHAEQRRELALKVKLRKRRHAGQSIEREVSIEVRINVRDDLQETRAVGVLGGFVRTHCLSSTYAYAHLWILTDLAVSQLPSNSAHSMPRPGPTVLDSCPDSSPTLHRPAFRRISAKIRRRPAGTAVAQGDPSQRTFAGEK